MSRSQGHSPGDPPRDARFDPNQLRDSPPPMKLESVEDLLCMNDERLERYIYNYFKIYGDLDVTIGGGTDDIPKRLLDRLQKEIRDFKKKQGRLVRTGSAIIHVGLLDKLDERLQEVADKGQIPTWKPRTGVSPPREPETPMLWCREGFSKDEEIKKRNYAWYMENCNRLEEDGGRSVVSLDGLTELRGSEQYRLKLLLWSYALGIPKDRASDVFEQQLATWEFFRRWQRYNRGLHDTGGFEEFAIHSWRKNRCMGTEEEYNEFLEDIRTDSPSVLMEEWEQEQLLRAQLQKHWREDCESFDEYGAAVERRLAKHGIYKTFKPDIDARSQDPVTTWTEYLGHMCWILDVQKEHQEEMLADHELYVATLTFEHHSLDRDDPDWEANLQKAQKGLDQAKENCQKLAARGQSKGSIFWQPRDLGDMKLMVICTDQLTKIVQTELRLVEMSAKPPKDGLPMEASLDGATNAAKQNAAVAIQEVPEDTTPQPDQSQQVVSTRSTSPLDVPDNPTSRSLKRKGSFSEQSERNTKSRKLSNGSDSQPVQALRRSERIPELERKRKEDEQKAREEEAKKAKKEEEAKRARAQKKAMRLQAEREKKQAEKAAKAAEARAAKAAKAEEARAAKAAKAAEARAAKAAKAEEARAAKAAKAEEARAAKAAKAEEARAARASKAVTSARVSKAANPRYTQPARRSPRDTRKPNRLGFP
ncbi:unnamed protein product [Clonostachys byssicola]|uniref:Uncharacterized protein n=1 Tax=Clonostachys byssicola TaxID=160290 RepID=A0A9N9XZL4_9HYPO|nr:unnamed protein product [Clonostachys byssicola]